MVLQGMEVYGMHVWLHTNIVGVGGGGELVDGNMPKHADWLLKPLFVHVQYWTNTRSRT